MSRRKVRIGFAGFDPGLLDDPPTAPTLLDPAVVSSSRADLEWEPGDGVNNSFNVYHDDGLGGEPTVPFDSTGNTQISVTGLSESTTYRFAVAGVGNEGEGPKSNIQEATTATGDNPGTVNDLSVGTPGETSLPLSFTEVDDGTGQPAKYAVRHGPVGFNWGDAVGTEVSTDGGDIPEGTGIGNTIGFTRTGLEPGVEYEFRAVAYRGTLNVDAVFGALGNRASGTTEGATEAPEPVTDLAVSPVGGSQIDLGWTPSEGTSEQDVLRCQGTTCTPTTVVAPDIGTGGSYSDAGLDPETPFRYRIRSKNAAGQADGNIAGTTTGEAGSGGGGENEPDGLTALFEHSFPSGWNSESGLKSTATIWPAGGNARYFFESSSNMFEHTDISAPASPPDVLRWRYAEGQTPGHGPGGRWNVGFGESTASAPQSELYVSYRVKADGQGDGWALNRAGTKLVGYVSYGKTDRRNQFFLLWNGGNSDHTGVPGPVHIKMDFTMEYGPGSQQYDPNQGTGALFHFDVWHHIEIYLKKSDPNTENGIGRMWIDGVLYHDHTNVQTNNDDATLGFYQLHCHPVWGGTATPDKAETDFLDIDHIYVSGKAA